MSDWEDEVPIVQQNYTQAVVSGGDDDFYAETSNAPASTNRDGPSENGEPKPPPSTYVPEESDELFGDEISSGINFSHFSDVKVNCTGKNVVDPINEFSEGNLTSLIIDNIKRAGYTKLTPVQRYSLPVVAAGRDLMACAQTGSGKTAAFLLPIINSIINGGNYSEGAKPQALIIAPTRELAVQIKDQSRKFSFGTPIKSVVLYGGTSVSHQLAHISEGCDILVATPGRLVDFVSRRKVDLSDIKFLVLDEADRMLDMGFINNIREVVSASMPETGTRQTLMFSATFPHEIQRLAQEFLFDYIFLTVGIVGGACIDVKQVFHPVARFGKREFIKDMLKGDDKKTLVFVETKKNADFLATFLCTQGIQTTSIHGDRLQFQREEALRDFKTGKRNVLVATAVAARGLDIRGVDHVINYDLPKSIDEFVHRIGRTGRVGNSGLATSFYDESVDSALNDQLASILSGAGQEVPEFIQSSGCNGGSGAIGDQDVANKVEGLILDDAEWD